RKGVIIASAEGKTEDEAMEIALEAGAADFEGADGIYRILTAPEEVQQVREAVEAKGMKIESAKIEMVPKNTVKVEAKDAERVLKLVSTLEDHDDVNWVAANYDIEPELIEQYSE
ncbi:YebC/PmpR family DNA-binding transcriptional regulator, partial [Candidatus Sumerlaeota bacterium]|nr:YebC/PmpR family DNA-binding transcriptional regulator [Candidatus Sumerlaeota bacterium]